MSPVLYQEEEEEEGPPLYNQTCPNGLLVLAVNSQISCRLTNMVTALVV